MATTQLSPFPLQPGYFQTLQHNQSANPPSVTISDALYGSHTVTEPILITLLQSPALVRLSQVHQAGITGLLSITPKVTRFEHSVGAFLIARSVGADLGEQVAALLHDVSHTALSHVVDWALTESDGESFHEVHKMRFIEGTELPEIVRRHHQKAGGELGGGAGGGGGGGNGDENERMRVFNEEGYPLAEMPAPHLCADRTDYALRDAVGHGKLSVQEAQQIFASLRAYPDAKSLNRILVMAGEDEQLALAFARAYLATDRDVWSNPAHIDMYQRAGQVIGNAVRSGSLHQEDLWKLSDVEFWEVLRAATDDAGRAVMKTLEDQGLPSEEDIKGLPAGTKIRTLDPDVLLVDGSQVQKTQSYQPLSRICPVWVTERDEYIQARRRLLLQP